MTEKAIETGQKVPLWTRDFILICLANLTIFLGFQMLLPTLPVYVKHLGGDEAMAGLVIGVFTISAVLIRPFVGMALDVYGRKVIYLVGLVIFLLSSLAYNWAPTVAMLLAIRFIHGFGWGAASTAGGTIATDVIPKQRLGEGMGYYGLAATLSMAVAPAAGLYIISNAGFTTLFVISAALGVATFILGSLIHYEKIAGAGQRGALYERSALRPSLVMFFVTTTYGAVVSFIALYGAQRGIVNIGIFFTVYAVVLTLIRPVAGILVDRRGFNVVVIPGIICIGAAMLVLSQAQTLSMFLLAGVIYGVGFGSVQPGMQALAVKNVPPNRRGAANATFFSSFDLGIGIGATLWGIVSKLTDYSQMYLYASIPALVALVVYIILSGREPQSTK
ncbi:MAG: MFS transporter [Desulfotomaculum sp. BICA1-6]|nr:MAG: MFS transporter [Peptococcaceae bacterium BRH_c8a]KJS72452.1 MAG: MFS transporter [Desulfotomaculum sp. BICA1-6]